MLDRSPENAPAPGASTPCWSCRTPVDARAPFCHACGTIQPPRAVDHFVRLGVKRQFDVDLRELERQYFGFQRRFHPDRFATKSAEERAFSLQHSTATNEAFETIRSPRRRAEYLLTLLGQPALPADAHTVGDPALLAEVLQLREALDESAEPRAMQRIAQDALARAEDCTRSIAAAFAAGNLAEAGKQTLWLAYLDKLADEIRARGRRPKPGP
ncbi:MAG: Fe-S protein assembly co-chaperone HscB [Alphaproteobacteria bacterium]|nr:Fe-S protein assembly co-chaperone HscB [Alphaproteobacteria bacterium]